MKKTIIPILFICLLSYYGCQREVENEDTPITKELISGTIQKGPFINGATINIYELHKTLAPSGSVFTTQILDNSGLFEIRDLSLISHYVQLRVDGYYFNEVTGTKSAAPLTLYALADIEDKSTINVNVITDLEKNRIYYLTDHGVDFSDAKKQAEAEVLKMFFIEKSDIAESESLDISKAGDDNAILLAISAMLQGFRTEAELSELLANISSDIRTDGVLNSPTLCSSLINDARLLESAKIRNNLENRYSELGLTVTIPNFEKYITQFVNASNYVVTKHIQYPTFVDSKLNVLYDSTFSIINHNYYSIGAYTPIGTKLKVVVKPTSGNNLDQFAYGAYESVGWVINRFYPDSIVFSTIGNNQMVYIPLSVYAKTSFDLTIFENNSLVATRTKTVIVQ